MSAASHSQPTEKPIATFHVYRGDGNEGQLEEFKVPVEDGMVVLDALHHIQAHACPDLAVRWNCKAAKCGSCSGEVNGKPSLMCKTRMDALPLDEPITVTPLRTFPVKKDLVTDVSWNYEKNKQIKPFTPRTEDTDSWKMYQKDVDRVQEFRKCIECFLCQDVCHVLRNHDKKDAFFGPRFMIRLASLDMHPEDTEDRLGFIKDTAGVNYCNITKCCTEVCPEDIHITDNGIIPLKERVTDEFYDPISGLMKSLGLTKPRKAK